MNGGRTSVDIPVVCFVPTMTPNAERRTPLAVLMHCIRRYRHAFELLEIDLDWECHTNASAEMFDLFDAGTGDGVLDSREQGFLGDYFEGGRVPMSFFDRDVDGFISRSE